MNRKIIIDTDPGIDDAIAIMFAFMHPDVEILGVTSIAGNKGLEMTTSNACKIVNYFDQNIQVYRGADRDLRSYRNGTGLRTEFDEDLCHGIDGLGSVDFPYVNLESDIGAVDFILNSINKYPGEIDLITLGPLTNVALCIEKNLDTMKKLKSVHSMGGGVFEGNMTPVSEFNYWYDPEAVDVVFTTLGPHVPIHMIGLDVTHKGVMNTKDVEFYKSTNTDIGDKIYRMLQEYGGEDWHTNGINGVVIHDLMTVIGYLYPEIYTNIYHAHLRCAHDNPVSYGQCIVDLVDSWKLEKNAYVPMTVNNDLYNELFVEVIFGTDQLAKYKKLKGEK